MKKKLCLNLLNNNWISNRNFIRWWLIYIQQSVFKFKKYCILPILFRHPKFFSGGSYLGLSNHITSCHCGGSIHFNLNIYICIYIVQYYKIHQLIYKLYQYKIKNRPNIKVRKPSILFQWLKGAGRGTCLIWLLIYLNCLKRVKIAPIIYNRRD